MFRFQPSWFAAASRFLYTHNPFYLLSALLVLYGLHRSTSAAVDWKGDALTIGLLFGYTFLLALLAFAVVRLGKVWDDARTIMLVMVLLLLAISVRFDVIALNNPRLGGTLLLAGFVFAALVFEGLLRGLRIRLVAMYRVPFYLLLTLFYSYPVWLAQLSVEGQDQRMAWNVFLFPAVASAALLTLWPAARWGGPPGPTSGTPWRWPWFPWSLFALMVFGIGLRAYWLSMAFQAGKAPDISFQPYFLAPLVLVTAFLLMELAVAAGSSLVRQIGLWLPLGLVLVAFPGRGGNPIAAEFLSSLCQHLGSPAQLIFIGLIVFYGVAWARGIRIAQWGMMGCLTALAWIDAQTLSLSNLGAPAMWPLQCVAVIQLGLALRYDRMWRTFLPIAIELGVAWQRVWQHWPLDLGIYWTVHALIIGLLLAGVLCSDNWARRTRLLGGILIPIAAIVALVSYDMFFTAVPRSMDGGYVAMLAAISIVYWYRTATVLNLFGGLTTITVLALMQLQQLSTGVTHTVLANGLPWLAWGLVSLLIAAAISAIKGGLIRKIGHKLERVNNRLQKTKQTQ
jgi:hypothetical protein